MTEESKERCQDNKACSEFIHLPGEETESTENILRCSLSMKKSGWFMCWKTIEKFTFWRVHG